MSALQVLLGTSPAITSLRQHVEGLLPRLAPGHKAPPILLQGETGTGKGLLARAIHAASPRAGGPFVEVTCSAIPETLLEAELFGFERGAFTDARHAKAGLLQSADGGTIFLDEVALLTPALQGKLLGVLESRSVRRLGGTRSERVDGLIVAATNTDLAEATRAGGFREDLYHRLAVLTFTLPPLRERGADVIELAGDFLTRACADYGLPAKTLHDDARAALLGYHWPGNVRELANLIERVTLRSDGTTIRAHHLGLPPRHDSDTEPHHAAPAGLRRTLEEQERLQVQEALRATGGNISFAAKRLGLPRSTLRHHLAKLGLSRRSVPSGPIPQAESPAPAAAQGARAIEPTAGRSIRWAQRHVALLYATLTDAARPMTQLDFVSQKVATFGGRVEDIGASGLLATFGSDGVDDGPGRASDAALAICRALARESGDAARAASRIRIAIHVTPLLVATVGGDVRIDVAAKRDVASVLESVTTRAEPGAIALTDAAVPYLSRRYRIEPASTSGSRTHRLVGPELMGGAGRPLTPFVGRERDMTTLLGLLGRLSDCAHAVAITGPPGIGKSRLLYEFREALRGKDFTCLEGRCTATEADVPHSALISLLRNGCGVADTDGPEAVADALDRHLAQLALDPQEIAPYILALLGLREPSDALGPNARAIQARTFDMLRRWLLNLARVRPTVVMLDDVHWIDRTSEGCVTALVRALRSAPILLITTSRHEYRPRWLDGPQTTELSLAPLPHDDSLSLVHAVLRAPAAEPTTRHILMRANGNPFFLEELSRDARERPPAEPSEVPGTIQQVLQERVDRLGDDARWLLEIASVIGQEIPLDLLEVLCQSSAGAIEPTLGQLVGLGFLHESRAGARRVYAFHHELTREAVYESLPPARREALHLAAGRAIEALWASRRSEVYDRLAHHYARGGGAAKAVEYLTRFAEQAARRYARSEAMTALHEALFVIERLPDGPEQDRLFRELILRQRHALTFLLNLRRDTLEFLLREEPRVDRMQDPFVAAHYHLWLSRVCAPLGEYELAVRSAERAIAQARVIGDDMTAAGAAGVLSNALAWLGYATDGERAAREAIERLEASTETYWLGYAYRGLALNSVSLGHHGIVRDVAPRLDALGEALGEPFFQFSAAWIPGLAMLHEGDVDGAIARFRQLIENAPGPLELAQATSLLAIAHLDNGEADAAIRLLEPMVAQADRLRQRHIRGLCVTYVGEAYRLKSDLSRARELAREAIELLDGTGYRWGVGCARRLLGSIALDAGQLAEARADLEAARELFAAVPVPHEHARTQALLATVAERRGDTPAARRHLESAIELWTAIGAERRAHGARESLTALAG